MGVENFDNFLLCALLPPRGPRFSRRQVSARAMSGSGEVDAAPAARRVRELGVLADVEAARADEEVAVLVE